MEDFPQITRRQITKGAAWSVPAIAVSASIPAYAASDQFTGLDGWVTTAIGCRADGITTTVRIDATDGYPERGLWVENAEPDTRVENALITFYLPTDLGRLSWSVPYGNDGWSTPAHSSSVPQRSGYYAYTTRYSGSWTYDAAQSIKYATGYPYFTASSTARGYCDPVTLYTYRSVDINGRNYIINRGPFHYMY